MYTYTCIFALFFGALSVMADDLLSINTPAKINACQPVTLTWQSGKGPYDLLIVPGDSPCDDALVDLGTTSNTWLKWEAPSLKPGTKVIVSLTDSTEEEVWSKELTIGNSTDTSCVNGGSTSAVDGVRTGTIANVGAQPTSGVSSGSSSGSNSDTPINAGGGISPASPRATISLSALLLVGGLATVLL